MDTAPESQNKEDQEGKQGQEGAQNSLPLPAAPVQPVPTPVVPPPVVAAPIAEPIIDKQQTKPGDTPIKGGIMTMPKMPTIKFSSIKIPSIVYWIVGYVCVAGLIGTASYYAFIKKEMPGPLKPYTYLTYKPYKSKDGSFRFRYPRNWTITEHTQKKGMEEVGTMLEGVVIADTNNPNGKRMQINIAILAKSDKFVSACSTNGKAEQKSIHRKTYCKLTQPTLENTFAILYEYVQGKTVVIIGVSTNGDSAERQNYLSILENIEKSFIFR